MHAATLWTSWLRQRSSFSAKPTLPVPIAIFIRASFSAADVTRCRFILSVAAP